MKILDILSKDKRMHKIIQETPPERIFERTFDGMVLKDLVSSIISQQLSTKVARVIYQRFLDLYSGDFPSVEDIIQTDHETLRSCGLSNQKAQYIKNIAEYFKLHGWQDEQFHAMTDDEIIASLTAIKGVGRWTVEMVLIFCLGREDVFALDDYGIQTALVEIYRLKEEKKALKLKMEQISQRWKPYRSTACLYLWAYKDLKLKI
ncbi:MAG: DNA-3-methyladenine glycosylase 2 family protein [Saprospiraceae bacterium]|nr:DNA-3-methyladenine glycosylase 2 family protein [Candidatus Vicinibacter proximus]